MLKNILNNLNRSKSSTSDVIASDMKLDGHGTGELKCEFNSVTKDLKTNEASAQMHPSMGRDSSESTKKKRLISRKGRKRLSAMVSALQSSIQSAKSMSRGAGPREAAAGQREKLDPYDLNDNLSDDDDEDYKSAEDEDCVAERATSRRPGKGGSGAAPAGPTHAAGLKLNKCIEQQSVEELLPEEQCDIPTFLHTDNCDLQLIEETRRLLRERYANNPDSFYDTDYKRMLSDDWTVSRFLLRRRQDPRRTAKLMEECGRFRRQYKMSEVKLWEFPMEFHKAGGLFKYAPDRVGNVTLYMRVKMYRRVPEISDVFKAFILCVLEECDLQNNGRGTAIIFDLSACGLQNVDLGFLSWLLSSFRNYCPKGVSYIIVYNLPWILNATCKLAMTWMSASNRRALRFAYGSEIEAFIARENLPDYCGGTCKINYRAIPEGSLPAIEVCDRLDMSQEQALKIRELFKEYLGDDDDQSELDRLLDAKSHYFDAKSLTSSGDPTSDITTTTTTTTPINTAPSDTRAPAGAAGESVTSTSATATHRPTGAAATDQQAQRLPVVDLVSRASKFIAH